MGFNSGDFKLNATNVVIALTGTVPKISSTVTFKLCSALKSKSDDDLPAGDGAADENFLVMSEF